VIPAVFADPIGAWQMTLGERAAYEGVLAFTRPVLAVEIGSAAGGSLARTAAWSGHVHAFDLNPPAPDVLALPNVTFHAGDSHQLLPAWLDAAAAAGEVAGFAHVDGDHETAGAARDIADLLGSPGFDGIMLIHDAANPAVRAGIDWAAPCSFPHVAYADWDFVPGRVGRRPDAEPGLAWGGIALIITSRTGAYTASREWASQGVRQDRYWSLAELIAGRA
jgi:Methyltransferase domain